MTEKEKQLLIENTELRFHLIENKMRLKALRSGNADTMIVSKNVDGKISELKIDENHYRIIIEEMNDGVCTLAENGTIIYCNHQFAAFLSIPYEQIAGSKFSKLVPDADKTILALVVEARQKGRCSGEIIYIQDPDIVKCLFLSVIPMPPELPGELFILVKDITETKQKGFNNEELLNNARLAALNIMEDEIEAKNALARTNVKLVEEIKERKKAACALNQIQRDLLQAQKMAHIGNWSYDLASLQATFSDEIFRIIGLDPTQPILDDKWYKKFIHPDDWLLINKASQIVIEHGVSKELELRFLRTDGKECIVLAICTPLLNIKGETIKLNGIIQDITERKHAEKELIKSNRLFTVISQINQTIVRKQVREKIFTEACNNIIEHGKFRMAWIGLVDEKEKIINPVCWAGAELGYLKKIKAITIKNAAEGNGPTGLAVRTGKYYYCNDIGTDPSMEIWREEALERNYRSSIALPIIVQNKIIGAFTIYVSEPYFFNQTEIDLLLQVTTDISFALEVAETEKKRQQAEKALKKLNAELEQRVSLRTVQLEHTNKELEAFTYSVSHDLRSPLRNINGWSQILQDECREQLGEKGCQYVDHVLIETRRMGNLIDDLLKLSRVTLVEKKQENVDLSTLAQNISRRLLDTGMNHQLELIIQPGLFTIGDTHMLDIALTNLLDNAFKFTGKQPLPRIEFGKSIINGKSTYWVRDNGIGFDMNQSKNLFGAFQRMHKQSDFPGTGIGLATVQRIIHRHDGNIWADSKINQGTTFYFTLSE